jgi:hypothetical protein
MSQQSVGDHRGRRPGCDGRAQRPRSRRALTADSLGGDSLQEAAHDRPGLRLRLELERRELLEPDRDPPLDEPPRPLDRLRLDEDRLDEDELRPDDDRPRLDEDDLVRLPLDPLERGRVERPLLRSCCGEWECSVSWISSNSAY